MRISPCETVLAGEVALTWIYLQELPFHYLHITKTLILYTLTTSSFTSDRIPGVLQKTSRLRIQRAYKENATRQQHTFLNYIPDGRKKSHLYSLQFLSKLWQSRCIFNRFSGPEIGTEYVREEWSPGLRYPHAIEYKDICFVRREAVYSCI